MADLEPSVVVLRDLRVAVSESGTDIVDGIDLELRRGEILALVGESGSGKTTLAMTLLGHTRRGAAIAGGEISVAGQELSIDRAIDPTTVRGRIVSYIPQDPPTALNPSMRIGDQLREMLDFHASSWSEEKRTQRLVEVLADVALPSEQGFLRRYPHQLSGGQQQRVAIAMAVACRPEVIICDEPTTGLDVTTQAQVLKTILSLCHAYHVCALYVTHDLAVVSSFADRVAVMYSGRIVEIGSRQQVLGNPRHPYTRRLLLAAPDLAGRRPPIGITGYAPSPGQRPSGCYFAPRCQLVGNDCWQAFPPSSTVEPGHLVCCYHEQRPDPIGQVTPPPPSHHPGDVVVEANTLSAFHGKQEVVHGVNLSLRAHECLALVGESGSGKTTLARCIVGLHDRFTGNVRFDRIGLEPSARKRTRDQRRLIQYVFQNPYASLNPRHTISRSLRMPLDLFFGLGRRESARRVDDLLDRVSLPASVASRFPDQLSGGERQRVAIARALAAEPRVLICDEITSSLDVSVQAAVIGLLIELRRDIGLSLLFITHNLALIRTLADRVIVLSDGSLAEEGSAADIFTSPQTAYTRQLLDDTPSLNVETVAVADGA